MGNKFLGNIAFYYKGLREIDISELSNSSHLPSNFILYHSQSDVFKIKCLLLQNKKIDLKI